MSTYTISDANAQTSDLSYADAVEAIQEWYSDCDVWADGQGDDTRHAAIAAAIASIEEPAPDGDEDDLSAYADKICQAVAVAMGHEDFFGHGNYAVSAASAGGYSLTVALEEDEEDEEDEEEEEEEAGADE